MFLFHLWCAVRLYSTINYVFMVEIVVVVEVVVNAIVDVGIFVSSAFPLLSMNSSYADHQIYVLLVHLFQIQSNLGTFVRGQRSIANSWFLTSFPKEKGSIYNGRSTKY